MQEFMDKVKYDNNGLAGAIMQDADTGEVLMFAFMNKEALQKTLETRKAHFYSRSRNKLWMKGEESGHTQDIQEVLFDCDVDCFVFKIRQKGGACHDGYRSCFYRKLVENNVDVEIVGEKIFDPDKVYK